MIVTWSKRLIERLSNRRYRNAYVAQNVRTGIAYQIRNLRGEMSQADFGKKIGKPQSVVSRLEDPDSGSLSIQTLLDVAAALDVALLVKYVSFPEFINRTRDVSPAGLSAPAFNASQFQTQPTMTAQFARLPSRLLNDVGAFNRAPSEMNPGHHHANLYLQSGSTHGTLQ